MSDQTIAAGPGVPVLEAMNVGMILDKAIHLYTRNFLLLIAITAIPQVIYAVGTMALTSGASAGPAAGLVGLVLILLSAVVNGIGGGAMTMVVGSRYLGKDITFGSAYLAALRKAGPLIGGALLAILFIFLGLMGFVIPGLVLAVSYCLIAPAIMLEGVTGARSLKRSRQLIKGYRWQAFLIYFLYWVALYVGILVVAVIVSLIMRLGLPETWQRYSILLITPVVTVLLGPFSAVLSVLLYYAQRIRKESFDLAFLAEAMAAHSP
jgi:hypothetical protein